MGQKPEQTPHQRENTNANEQMKRCSTSSVIRKMHIKTIMRYHYTPIRMVEILDTYKEAVRKRSHAGGNAECYGYLVRQWGGSLRHHTHFYHTVFPAVILLGIYSKELENLGPHKNLHVSV